MEYTYITPRIRVHIAHVTQRLHGYIFVPCANTLHSPHYVCTTYNIPLLRLHIAHLHIAHIAYGTTLTLHIEYTHNTPSIRVHIAHITQRLHGYIFVPCANTLHSPCRTNISIPFRTWHFVQDPYMFR